MSSSTTTADEALALAFTRAGNVKNLRGNVHLWDHVATASISGRPQLVITEAGASIIRPDGRVDLILTETGTRHYLELLTDL